MKNETRFVLEDGFQPPVYFNDINVALNAYDSLYNARKDILLASHITLKKYNKKAFINYFHYIEEFGMIRTVSLSETKVFKLK